MSTHFDRLRAQHFIERFLGCKEIENWGSYRRQLEEFQPSEALIFSLKEELLGDAQSLYERSLLTFASAIQSIQANAIGWALVKFYYSTFYSVRCTLAIRQHCLIRNKCWYHLDLSISGGKPIKLASDLYRNDHDTALNLYSKLFKNGDFLLSNNIDGLSPFQWLMEVRNDSNYRTAKFPDPAWPAALLKESTVISLNELGDLWQNVKDDSTSVRIFQPDFAWLAIPSIQLRTATKEFKIRGITWSNPSPLKNHFHDVIALLPKALLDDFYIPN